MYRTLGLGLLFCLCSGCATVISGGAQEVAFETTPPGANVEVDGYIRGTTPLSLTLERKNPHAVRITLDGYKSFSMLLERSMNAWIFGNILIGGFLGLGVDFITGAAYELSPEPVSIVLEPAVEGSGAATDGPDGSLEQEAFQKDQGAEK